MFKTLTPIICVAALAAGGASAATPIWWTPAHMAKALTALQYPHPGILAGTCKGATKARRGAYTGFRCQMTWQIEGTGGVATTSGKATVWARPLAHGRVCGSTISLASCRPLKPGPLAGDPTVCFLNDPARCAENAAELAARKHVGGPGGLWQGPSFDCTLIGTLKYSCPLDQVYTVTFTKGVSAWTATVTP